MVPMDRGQYPEGAMGRGPACPMAARHQGPVLGGTMGLKVTHLPWGANLSRDTGVSRGAWHTSVPLLTLGTAGPLPREQCHL